MRLKTSYASGLKLVKYTLWVNPMFWRYKGVSEVQLSGKLAGKTLMQQVIVLSVWPFFQNIMGTIVSFVDMMISGRMSAEDIHGYQGGADVSKAMIEMMGPVVYVIWLMMILQGSIGMGAQALVARAIGAKDRSLAEKAFGQALVLGFAAGGLAGLMIYCFVDPIVQFANISVAGSQFAKEYISVVAFSAPLSGVLFVANSCMRASGDTVRPFIAMFVVNLTNAGLSALFVYAPYPFGGYGAAGIAMGTVIGWAAGVAVVLWVVRPRMKHYTVDDPMVLKWNYVRYSRKLFRRIMRISLPNAIEVLGMCTIHIIGFRFVSNIGQRYAEKVGVEGEGVIVGAHALAVRVESLSFMPAFALGMAASTLAGQYLGAESKELAKKSVRFCWVVTVIIMTIAGILMYIFADSLVGILMNGQGPQREFAVGIIHIFAFSQPLFATAMVMKMSMRGAGATGTVMMGSFTCMILVRVLLLGWYAKQDYSTIHGAWWIMVLDLLVQAIVFTILHFRGKWLNAQV